GAEALADLDSRAYAKPVSPAAARAEVPATPAAVFAEDAPYTLDTGDKLRVVVFGQEILSNSYVVDAGGAITMPLIKAVPARGLTTAGLARAGGGRPRQGVVGGPHVAVAGGGYRPVFFLGGGTGRRPYTYTTPL